MNKLLTAVPLGIAGLATAAVVATQVPDAFAHGGDDGSSSVSRVADDRGRDHPEDGRHHHRHGGDDRGHDDHGRHHCGHEDRGHHDGRGHDGRGRDHAEDGPHHHGHHGEDHHGHHGGDDHGHHGGHSGHGG